MKRLHSATIINTKMNEVTLIFFFQTLSLRYLRMTLSVITRSEASTWHITAFPYMHVSLLNKNQQSDN